MTLQTSCLTPPEVITRHMHIHMIPFVAMQMLAVLRVFLFPQLALWLPKVIGW